MRIARLALPLLLSTTAYAQDVNPFLPGANVRPDAAIFAPPARAELHVLLPPPLPPAPAAVQPAAASEASAAAKPEVISDSGARARCAIEVTPAAPLVGAQGGDFVLRVNEDARARGCVAGIESRAAWLKIRYFNGSQLTLQADANTSRTPRAGELMFANAEDSLVIRIQQAAP